jgi:hypothetical protein
MIHQIRFCLVALALFSVCSKATAQQHSLLAENAWAAWSCSTLASISGNDKDRERLFKFGYESGKESIQSLKDGKISAEEWNGTAPIGFAMRMQGPSIDFVLGRIFEFVQTDTYDAVVVATKAKDASSSELEALRKRHAENRFRRENCHLLFGDAPGERLRYR